MGFLADLTKPKSSLLGVVLAMAMAAVNSASANPVNSEQALTVVFLYNFLKFTEWPQAAISNDITLCVTDSAALGAELDGISGKPVQNKSVRIRRIELGENPNECQLLFLPQEEKPIRIREWLKNTANTPTLMVSNLPEFLDMGGMITLVNDGSHMQFEVNLARVKPTGLKLSAQLLKLAREVRGN